MPASEPPAIRPELKSVPALMSDSSFTPVFRSTHHRTTPPAKMGAVVAIGRYEPTAKESEWMPHSSRTIEIDTPHNTSPHGRFWLSRPLMMVDIRVACGAGSDCDPMPITECRYSVV